MSNKVEAQDVSKNLATIFKIGAFEFFSGLEHGNFAVEESLVATRTAI